MTAVDVMKLIQSSDTVAVSALIKLFKAGQDEDEQQAGATVRQNGRGFSGTDAKFLTSLAVQAIANREKKEEGTLPEGYAILSPRQLASWRKVAPKYSRQLTGLANGEDPATYKLPKEEKTPATEERGSSVSISSRSLRKTRPRRLALSRRYCLPSTLRPRQKPSSWFASLPRSITRTRRTGGLRTPFSGRSGEPPSRMRR